MVTMSYLKSIVTGKKQRWYGQLTQDEDGEKAEVHIHPDMPGKGSLLKWSFMSNVVLALVVLGLLSRMLRQPTVSNTNTSTHYHGVGPVQLLEDQRGLTSKVIKTYRFFEDNMDDDDFGKGDPYWAELFPYGGGQCFLEDEVVASYKLAPSMRHPAKGNFSAYEMAGYHSLHCLVIASFWAAQKDGPGRYDIPPPVWEHTLHCLSDIRQSLLCNLDETLLVISATIHPGYHQNKVCKDLDPVVGWLEWNFEGKFGGKFEGA